MTAPSTRPPILSAGPKLEARRKAERRQRARRWLRKAGFGLLALLPVVLLGWVVLSSPLFDLDRIEVTGATSPEVVQEAAGIDTGRPLALIDTGAVRKRVAALASVSEVSVRRDWPGTLRIAVVERAPMAAVAVRGGGYRLLASDGTPYATVAKRPAGIVPMTVPAPGPSRDDPTTQAGLDVLSEVGAPVRAKITSVFAQSPQRVVLVVQRRLVVWGKPGDHPEDKTKAVQVLLRTPGGQIDVTAPGVATVTGAVP